MNKAQLLMRLWESAGAARCALDLLRDNAGSEDHLQEAETMVQDIIEVLEHEMFKESRKGNLKIIFDHAGYFQDVEVPSKSEALEVVA